MPANFTAPVGTAQRLYIDPADIHLFDPATTNVHPAASPRRMSSDAA